MITPALLLRLWRERWDLAQQLQGRKPLAQGRPLAAIMQFPNSQIWTSRWVSVLAGIVLWVSVLLTWWVPFTVNGQLTIAGLLIILAYGLRRFAGSFISFALLGLLVIAAGRYLGWRFMYSVTPEFTWTYFLSFGLILLELSFVLIVIGSAFQTWWPRWQDEVSLPSETHRWPVLDVVLVAESIDAARLLNFLLNHRLMEWPTNQLRVHLVVNHPSETLRLLCFEYGVRLHFRADQTNLPLERLAQSLDSLLIDFDGEFTVVLTDAQLLPVDLYKRALGWLQDDLGLNLIYTPGHLIAPVNPNQPPVDPVIKHLKAAPVEFAVIRRAAWVRIREYLDAQEEVVGFSRIFDYLHRHSARVRFEPLATASKQDIELQAVAFDLSDPPQAQTAFRLQRHDRAHVASVRMAHRFLDDSLQLAKFYAPMLYLLLQLAPVYFLYTQRLPSSASLGLFLAYAIPAWGIVFFVHQRCKTFGRWGSWREILEGFYGLYLLLPTALSFILTCLRHPLLSLRRSLEGPGSRVWRVGRFVSWLFLVGAQCVAIVSAVLWGSKLSGRFEPWIIALGLWALFNLLVLLANQALLLEARHIQWFQKQRFRLPITLQLPFGRTLRGELCEFPAVELQLRLPLALDQTGLNLKDWQQVMIWRSGSGVLVEGMLSAVEHHAGENRVRFQPAPTSQATLRALEQSFKVRSHDWPAWLPGPAAIYPLPAWLSRPLSQLPVRVLDWSIALTKYLNWNQWKLLWKGQ